MKKIITYIILLVVFACCLALFEGCKVRKGEVFDSYELECESAKLRVIASHEFSYLFNFIPGAYYDFEFKRSDGSDWEHLYTQRCDDPIKIPTDRIRKLGDDVVIAYMYDFFMSSQDGGVTWAVFDVQKSKYNGSILEVKTVTQPWVMTTRTYGLKSNVIIKFHSNDFGETWDKKSIEPVE